MPKGHTTPEVFSSEISPEKIPRAPKGKESILSSNHPFSGAMSVKLQGCMKDDFNFSDILGLGILQTNP